MEELFKKSMDQDEKLLWCSCPEKFEILDKTYKPLFIKKLAISLVIAIAISVAYFLLAAKNGTSVKWAIIIIIWALSMIAPANIIRDANALLKNAKYGITNKRFITVLDNDRSVEFSKIDKAVFYTDIDGRTSILCGADAVNKANGNLRSLATSVVSMNKDESKCECYVMYSVPEADRVKKLLSDYIPTEQI